MRLSDRRKKNRRDSKKEKHQDPDQPSAQGHTSHHASSSTAISNIHRVQEVELQEMDITQEYDIQKTLAEGCFARIILATNKKDKTTVVLKAVHTELTNLKDFSREYHYSYNLSPHPSILSSYEVCFKAENCFIFAQEYAPFGDLAANVKAGGLSEEYCKRIAQQLSSALEFTHSKQLVHRDIKLENVLVFEQDMSRVKLCDFGATRREGTMVSKLRCNWLPFVPPEIHEIVANERYTCTSSSDVWQLAILIFVCLTGCPPWQSADCISDSVYGAFYRFQKKKITKAPYNFRKFTPRLLRMLRRMFEPKPDMRAAVTEVGKYLKDSWIDAKLVGSHSAGNLVTSHTFIGDRRDSLQTYLNQFEQTDGDDNKTRLKRLLSSYGLETSVDQRVLTKRVWDWVLTCDTPSDGNLSSHCSMTSLTTLNASSKNLESKVC